MKHKKLLFRIITFTVLTAFMQLTFLPLMSYAQAGNCNYDPEKPSVEHARDSFKMLNYKCAEQELNDYLAQDSITIEEKASAHVLLASVYYAMLKNDTEKRDRVTEEFVKAFKAYRDWRGELDIKSSEFLDLMEIAKTRVDDEAAEEEVAIEEPATTEPEKIVTEQPELEPEPEKPATVTPTQQPEQKKKKAWYTNWWAIAGGVGLVAIAAVALGGGGGDGGGEPPPDLPGIPDPPVTGK